MRIFNNFMFRNEYDLLEIRLATEYKYVDEFIILESDHTHQGTYKGYNLEKVKDRYSKWWDKIRYVKIGYVPNIPIAVEQWSRRQFYPIWNELKIEKDDVLVLNDCDELIRPETYQLLRNSDYDYYHLGMPFFQFKFNYVSSRGLVNWPLTRAFRGYWNRNSVDGMRWQDGVPGGTSCHLIHSGWHFSYLGDRDWIIEKLKSFCHPEAIADGTIEKDLNIEKYILMGGSVNLDPKHTFSLVKLDDYFPKYILDNKEKFSQYISPHGTNSILDILPGNISSSVTYDQFIEEKK